MNKETIRNRMAKIQEEHEKIVEKIQNLQSELNQMTTRRIQLEGAFNELGQMLEEEEKAESASVKPTSKKESK